MSQINPFYSRLVSGYLFPEIGRRTREFISNNPDRTIFRMGIGDTTRPLAPSVVTAMTAAVQELGVLKTYSGYGDSEGTNPLRVAISNYYQELGCEITTNEIFVSDGAKSDSANIQSIFATDNIIGFQDPAYPVYVDSNVIAGRSQGLGENAQYKDFVYLECNAENGFIPQVPTQKVDILYLCFPNNPTGAVATRAQLQAFVDWANANQSIIIYDAAYSWFITDPELPRSIYEIEGAKKCAIEIQSFSKFAGFTGVRLGWSVVPQDLVCSDSQAGELNKIWTRRQNTMFNGASNIAQAGGVAALSEIGRRECQETIDYYMQNAKLIKTSLEALGLDCFGGDNAPYIWVKTPNGLKSWEFFDKLIQEAGVVGTPGSGFGPSGEGYFRFSAFANRESVELALESIRGNLKI